MIININDIMVKFCVIKLRWEGVRAGGVVVDTPSSYILIEGAGTTIESGGDIEPL